MKFNLEREVEKYQVKKSKLTNSFLNKVQAHLRDTVARQARIEDTIQELENEAFVAQVEIDEAEKVLKEVK